jgi:hypothetical protein
LLIAVSPFSASHCAVAALVLFALGGEEIFYDRFQRHRRSWWRPLPPSFSMWNRENGWTQKNSRIKRREWENKRREGGSCKRDQGQLESVVFEASNCSHGCCLSAFVFSKLKNKFVRFFRE